MSEQEKKIGERIAKAVEMLPESEQKRLLGFAEGVEAMAKRQKAEAENETPAE